MAVGTENLEKMSFEERLAKLERIVETLEEGKLGLATSLELFEEAVALARSCRSELEDAELRITHLTDKAEGMDRPAVGEADDEAE